MDQKLGITGRKKLMNVREMKIGNGNTHLNKEMVTKIGIKMGGGGVLMYPVGTAITLHGMKS